MFDDEVSPQQSSELPPASMAGGSQGAPQPHEDEVPDIFDGSDLGTPPPGDHMADSSPETSILGPSALESGKLQRMQQSSDHPMGMDTAAAMQTADLHEPTAIKRIMIAAVVLVVVALIGFGVWFTVIRKAATSVTPMAENPIVLPLTPPTDTATALDQGKGNVDVDATEPIIQPEPQIEKPANVPLPTPAVDTQKDSDKDGLTDEQEAKLGTDANNPDTDGDGLNDSAEVNIWGTDPLVKDTDNDGFTDGQEVLNGFNPKGSGKAH